MTCIAGFIDQGVAYIGADSCVSYGDLQRQIQSGRKLFVKGDYLFGCAGDVRFEQILRSAFTPPTWRPTQPDAGGEALHGFLIASFVPQLISCLKEIPGAYDQLKGRTDSTFLLSTRGHLFEIDCDLTVCRPDNRLFALGTGERLALGALHATAHVEETPSARMTRALRAAAHYDKLCAPPFFWGWTSSDNPPKILPLALN